MKMNKKYNKAALVGFLTAVASAFSACSTDDARAQEFAEYIKSDVDSIARRALNDDEMMDYVNAYNKNPALFNQWISDLAADSIQANKSLVKRAAAIHKMDAAAGHELSFADAVKELNAMTDSLPGPDQPDEIMMKRLRNRMIDTQTNLNFARAAKSKSVK